MTLLAGQLGNVGVPPNPALWQLVLNEQMDSPEPPENWTAALQVVEPA
jgi:hypothetical protein